MKIAAALICAILALTQSSRFPVATPGDLVELDVVVVGRDGQTSYRFGFQAKYTGTPSRTMIRPGHVVAVR